MAENLVERRTHCIEWYGTAEADVYDLVYARRWWFRLGEVIEYNDALPEEDNFYGVLGDWYAKYLAAGVRRHVDLDARTWSLRRLLTQLREQPDLVLSLDEYSELHPEFLRDEAVAEYAAIFPQTWVDGALNQLVTAAEPARRYVNSHVAHLERKEASATYGDLHGGLDTLVEVLLKTKRALTGRAPTVGSFCKAAEQFDWARTLRVAWVNDAVWPHVANS